MLPEEQNPLTLMTLEDIKDELARRYSAFLLVTEQSVNDSKDFIQVSWGGGQAAALGLARLADHDITHNWKER